MSLNISQLCQRVAERFPDFERVDDSTVRFTRKAREGPFAVYYLDVAEDLPATEEKLTKYLDRVIGRHYFEERQSLQWNSYLYFIVDEERLPSSDLVHAREFIERDRRYARKFVISENAVDSVLAPQILAHAGAIPRVNVLSIWRERLIDAGIDKAIFSDAGLPARLAMIESASVQPTSGPKKQSRKVDIKTPPFIRSLSLKGFRDFPLQRQFKFGDVNLIFGNNGSGKTSLLEAIELFYCGRNKRNPGTSPQYELTVVFPDGRTEKVTNRRRDQEFRDRNLAWYGQAEVKTNNIYQSFAQFNFLDTDAAVSLADSASRIEDDLSKLLVGPDASKTWREIERVCNEVSSKLRGLHPLKSQSEEELAVLDRRLKEASSIRYESDSIRARLEEMIHRLGWGVPQDDKEVSAGKLVESLSELISLAQQATDFDWTESPVSIDGLANFCRETKLVNEKAASDFARFELLRKSQKRHEDAVKRDREALNLLQDAKLLIDAGVPDRIAERDKLQGTVASYSDLLVSPEVSALVALPIADQNLPVTVCYENAVSRRTSDENLLTTAKREYSNYSKLRDQSLNLAQELRQVADRILRGSTKPDECPLCHTQFDPGELAKHIAAGVDEHLEAVGQGLLSGLRGQEAALNSATAVEAASMWLRKFCENLHLPAEISVRLALIEVENAKRVLSDAQARLEVLNTEILAHDSQGLSRAKLSGLLTHLEEIGYPLAEVSKEAVDRQIQAINQGLESSSRSLESEKKEADELGQTLEATLGSAEPDVPEIRSAISRRKERLVATESLRLKLVTFSSSFPWPGRSPLAELAVEAESIRKVAAELQTALSSEKEAHSSYTESVERRNQLVKKLDELRPRVERLVKAQATLEDLQTDHSLKGAMEDALRRNRAGVEEIFLRIHSPADFRGLGPNWTTLVRKVGGTEAKLSEISSGQRAAFALSIFLAQNDQLTVAPTVVLMDDPIAHVDDLNSLSFLDYLREIALTGRRQIFFSTANNKLAILFQRKFDFLGPEGFRRIDLTREIPQITSAV
jgi:recombinational DNA repair ATPase RecF